MNILYYDFSLINGDNLQVLPLLPDASFDIIYLDPFFFANRNFTKVDIENEKYYYFDEKFG